MTRLANVENAGFFPIPPAVTDLILTHIAAPHGGRVLDPAAGEGVALATLAAGLGLEPFGVELHEERAKAAREAIAECGTQNPESDDTDTSVTRAIPHRVLQDSYRNLRTTRKAYSLLYLNPPYDYDEEDGRLEYQWLVNTRPWLQPGGLLVWVVPRHLLRFRRAARYLASWYEDTRVYRFPDPDYGRFRQIVLFGVRRAKATTPDPAQVERWAAQGAEESPLSPLTAVSEPTYPLPPPAVPAGAFIFRSLFVDPRDALAEARQVGARTSDAWRAHLDPSAAGAPLHPLAPLKIGHMHGVIAAGHLNNQILAEDGERLLIKGRSYKVTRPETTVEPLPDGRSRQIHRETEHVMTDVTSLDEGGEVTSHAGPGLETFLGRWLPHLTKIVATAYPPRYQFDLNGYGPALERLSKERPIPGLPGQSGLLPAQKHAAAALLTRLETHPDAICVGEMGTGKTTVAAAVAAGRRARRTVVLCPPHLVAKWRREFKAVWPGVRTVHLKTVSDVDQFFARQPDDAPLVGVLKQTSARSASGWEHAYDYGGPAGHNYGSKGFRDVRRAWHREDADEQNPSAQRPAGASAPAPLTYRRLLKRPTEERPFTEKQIHALQQRGVRCPVCGATQFISDRPLSIKELKTAARKCSNLSCRSPLYQFTRRRSQSQTRGSFHYYAERERAIRRALAAGRPAPTPFTAATPRDRHGYGKVPLAGYIKKQARGRLDLLIVDEVHQYKGVDSDQGYAMHHLAEAAGKVVALTGTIYGGKASSLFYLLFRLSPQMARHYVDPNAAGQRRLRSREWVSAYGILQRIETTTLDEDGRQTANSRSSTRMKELPGGSPAMLPWLLNRSVFLSLGDMGFPLPPYEEIPIGVAMAPEQADLYESLRSQLKDELKERLVRGDKSLLAGYLYALLFWPDSPRRAKVVRCPRSGDVVASVPALPDDFVGPKEEEIIALCREEKAQGRRVLLLCQQTDTLDIQPEWKEMLARAGLKAAILRAAPSKREKWVEKQVAAGVDVILSHPRKVETGIDLLDFPTIVWMAIDYSVYTVLQASRRSWRIGQTEPVKVYYFAYEETIQADALRLVAAKVAAALRVNGDTVDTDGLADLDEMASGDLVSALAKIVTGEAEMEAGSLQEAFAAANASLRQANTVIGQWRIEQELELEGDAEEVVGVSPVNGRLPQLPSPAANGKRKNGDGVPRQGSLFAQTPTGNGRSGNGAGEGKATPNGTSRSAQPAPSPEAPPPVPRPRLRISVRRTS